MQSDYTKLFHSNLSLISNLRFEFVHSNGDLCSRLRTMHTNCSRKFIAFRSGMEIEAWLLLKKQNFKFKDKPFSNAFLTFWNANN